ncbi:SET domain-containing protein [Agrocybe pediades]|nr:SET domain-containing protein [Agrocybe pediades]
MDVDMDMDQESALNSGIFDTVRANTTQPGTPHSSINRTLALEDDGDEEFELVRNTNEVTYFVYNSSWGEFYGKWEQDYCHRTLSDLLHGRLDPPRNALAASEPGPFEYKPHPKSEWFTIDDHDFVESKAFNIGNYVEDFMEFAWQTDFADPDLEMIQMEAARRLHYGHQMSFETMDNLGIFAHGMIENRRYGLIWNSHQRDQLSWSGNRLSHLPDLPSSFVNLHLSLEDKVIRDLPQFCGRLNCMKHFCKIHGNYVPHRFPKPSIKNEYLLEDSSEPCGDDCFKKANFDYPDKDNHHWDRAEHDLFKSVLKMAPDTRPCNMAIICRKPCFETYIERLNLLNDDDIDEFLPYQAERRKNVDITFNEDSIPTDLNAILEPFTGPCYHDGSCYTVRCPCYKARQRCEPSCRCSKSCKIRWRGCKCRDNCAKSSTCPCRRVLRECDPRLCVSLASEDRCCKNTYIQKGHFSEIRISPSQWGLGAFAVNAIRKDKYIGGQSLLPSYGIQRKNRVEPYLLHIPTEYVGEIFDGEQMAALGTLQNYAGLNYAFGLTGENLSLDSWFIGNETRYLNHSREANCSATVFRIDGDLRIVLQTGMFHVHF